MESSPKINLFGPQGCWDAGFSPHGPGPRRRRIAPGCHHLAGEAIHLSLPIRQGRETYGFAEEQSTVFPCARWRSGGHPDVSKTSLREETRRART